MKLVWGAAKFFFVNVVSIKTFTVGLKNVFYLLF